MDDFTKTVLNEETGEIRIFTRILRNSAQKYAEFKKEVTNACIRELGHKTICAYNTTFASTGMIVINYNPIYSGEAARNFAKELASFAETFLGKESD